MASTLFIRLQHGQVSWRVDEAGGAGGEGDLEQAAAQIHSRQVVVIVPVTDCPLFQVTLPTRNRARMAQAIPYALEDRLSEDVDDLHFAIGKPDSDGSVSVAVVSHARMEQWLLQLQQTGIRPRRLVPDVLCLPLHPGAWTGLLEPGSLLLRQGSQQGIALDSPNLTQLLPLALDDVGEHLPDRLQLLNCDDSTELPPLELALETEECGGTPLHHLIAGYDQGHNIDLLQGRYSPSEQAAKLWRTWRIVVFLGLLWLTVSVVTTAMENQRLAAEELGLRQAVTEVYRQTFPEQTSIVDPRLQMDRNLAALRQGGSGSGGQFLSLLAKAATPLSADRSIKLVTVRFKQARLDLELELPDLQKLDKLKAKMESLGLEVKIRNARSREGKVEGRLEIREVQK